MKKKVIKAEPQSDGTLLTYEDGSQEFLQGVTAQLNKDQKVSDSDPLTTDDDEESLMDSLKKTL